MLRQRKLGKEWPLSSMIEVEVNIVMSISALNSFCFEILQTMEDMLMKHKMLISALKCAKNAVQNCKRQLKALLVFTVLLLSIIGVGTTPAA